MTCRYLNKDRKTCCVIKGSCVELKADYCCTIYEMQLEIEKYRNAFNKAIDLGAKELLKARYPNLKMINPERTINDD